MNNTQINIKTLQFTHNKMKKQELKGGDYKITDRLAQKNYNLIIYQIYHIYNIINNIIHINCKIINYYIFQEAKNVSKLTIFMKNKLN